MTSWIVVAEWTRPDGQRMITFRRGGGHDGNTPPPAWQVEGMLRAAIRNYVEMLADVDDDDGPDPD